MFIRQGWPHDLETECLDLSFTILQGENDSPSFIVEEIEAQWG